MGLKINSLIFFIGILLSLLTFLTSGLYALGYAVPTVLIAFLKFLGIFLTGWALLGYAVMKEMLQKQRLIAFLFAIILLVSVFITYAMVTYGMLPPSFAWGVSHLH